MARTTSIQTKLDRLNEKLAKAEAIRKKAEKEITNVKKQISELIQVQKMEMAKELVTNPDVIKLLLEVGSITQEQFNILSGLHSPKEENELEQAKNSDFSGE